MNRLEGTISRIERSGSIMLVDVDVDGHRISALMIDAPQGQLSLDPGKTIGVIFKETEVSLGKDVTGRISLRNQFPCIVRSVTRGDILSVIEMHWAGRTITSAITTRSADMLGIVPGDSVTAFIKANEITLTEGRG